MIEPEDPTNLAWRWTGVYGLNLLVPLPVGLMLTQEHGLVGVITAVFICWLVGFGAGYQLPRATGAMTDGAIFVAMFQAFPVVHVAVGIAAAIAWEQVCGFAPGQSTGWRAELAGFGVTVLTALPLMFGAWVLGGGPRVLFTTPVARIPDEIDYIYSLAIGSQDCDRVPSSPSSE